MTIAEMLLAQLEREIPMTRRALEGRAECRRNRAKAGPE
jgi:hypothetical protein